MPGGPHSVVTRFASSWSRSSSRSASLPTNRGWRRGLDRTEGLLPGNRNGSALGSSGRSIRPSCVSRRRRAPLSVSSETVSHRVTPSGGSASDSTTMPTARPGMFAGIHSDEVTFLVAAGPFAELMTRISTAGSVNHSGFSRRNIAVAPARSSAVRAQSAQARSRGA